jgi:hypothetical protein
MLNRHSDEELATAVERITAVVHESIADFKSAAPALVQSLSDDEWTKLKHDEDCRRRRVRNAIPGQALSLVRLLNDTDLARLLWFVSDHSWQRASRELLPAFIKADRDREEGNDLAHPS